MQSIVIIGAGGFAREVLWLINDINKNTPKWNVLGFIDEDQSKHGMIVNNKRVIGGLQALEHLDLVYVVCAVGNPDLRERLVSCAKSYPNIRFATLIHPSVIMSDYVDIGEGSIICAGSFLTTNIQIGKHVIVNLDCTIGHDARIDDYCSLMPSVNVSGNCVLNKSVYVGTSATLIQSVEVGQNSVIGAGAVVIRDLPANCTAVGVPAKPIK